MKRFFLIGFVVAGFLQPAHPLLAGELDRLVAEAVVNNPEVSASEARWEALVSRTRQAGTFEDPMIMLRAQSLLIRDPFNFERENMTSKVVGVSQMVPFFGKRALKKEIAEREAEAGRWLIEERRLELQSMVKETWAQLYYVDQSLVLIERTIGVLDDLSRFTETLYGVGEGLQQDVLKAQLERSRMEEMRIVLQQRRRTMEAILNTLAYRPANTEIPFVAELPLMTAPTDAVLLEKLAEQHRPLIKSLSLQTDKARTGRELADREYYPDFTFSLEWMQREPTNMGSEGYDMYSAGVSFNLPVQRERRRAMIAEAEAETRMAQDEQEMLRNRIRLGIADILAQLERSRRLVSLYRDAVIPQATHAFEASMSAYRVGKADFMNVLDGQMRLFSVEREYHDAVSEHQMQMARLENIVGVTAPFDEAPITAAGTPLEGTH